MATAWFKHLTETHQEQHREGAAAIMRDFYMDDFLGGAETNEKIAELLVQLTTLLNTAGMKLRKWSSNDISLIKSIVPEEDIELSNDLKSDSTVKKISELFWDASYEKLRYKITQIGTKLCTIYDYETEDAIGYSINFLSFGLGRTGSHTSKDIITIFVARKNQLGRDRTRYYARRMA